MLTSGICQSYYRLRDEVLAQPDVETLAKGSSNAEASNQSQATIARVSGKAFIQQPTLHEEVFGPFSLLVVCADVNELETALSLLAGQLTATVMGSAEEVQQYEGVVDRLAERSGRLIMNGVPTGVEVCTSMQHGGPFPASSDARFGSVGRHAILRFVRPQSFQDWADSLLPDELKNSNPLGIRRLVNDQWTTAAVE
jgi:NADP-dependent aldehyde dehydrogenase